MANNRLEVKNIYKNYVKREVVNNVSFAVDSGQIVGLLGPNGAGKTTCFYIACGIIRADKGEIFINQHNVSKMPIHERAKLGLGYLPQEASIFRKLSVKDNIMAVLELNNLFNSNKDRKNRLEELLAEFNIEHISRIKGFRLSGGERRRVEIARALSSKPRFLLLDEPFAGIDPIAVSDLKNTLMRLKNLKIGILISDHNVREAMQICDKVLIMSEGKAVVEGSPEEVSNNDLVKEIYLGKDFSS